MSSWYTRSYLQLVRVELWILFDSMANDKKFCGLRNPHPFDLRGRSLTVLALFLYNQNRFNLLCSQRMFHLALFNSAIGTTCIILHLIEFESPFDIQKYSCKSLLFGETSDWRSWKLKFRPREKKNFGGYVLWSVIGDSCKSVQKSIFSKKYLALFIQIFRHFWLAVIPRQILHNQLGMGLTSSSL